MHPMISLITRAVATAILISALIILGFNTLAAEKDLGPSVTFYVK